MNFSVEFQPGPPYSLGQLGQSQPLPANFFCHCSSRSLETWLVRLRRLSSATSVGMLAASQPRTSLWKASSSSLNARSISSLHSRHPDRSTEGAKRRDLFFIQRYSEGEKTPRLRCAALGVMLGLKAQHGLRH